MSNCPKGSNISLSKSDFVDGGEAFDKLWETAKKYDEGSDNEK